MIYVSLGYFKEPLAYVYYYYYFYYYYCYYSVGTGVLARGTYNHVVSWRPKGLSKACNGIALPLPPYS
jgi:hypothetical protein